MGKPPWVGSNPLSISRRKPRSTIPKATLWRAIKAKCATCRAFYRMDCEIVSCPLYMFLKQREGIPSLWWMEHSAKTWSTLPQSVICPKVSMAPPGEVVRNPVVRPEKTRL